MKRMKQEKELKFNVEHNTEVFNNSQQKNLSTLNSQCNKGFQDLPWKSKPRTWKKHKP